MPSATSKQYKDLKEELESLGYSLRIGKRFTRMDYYNRIEQLKIYEQLISMYPHLTEPPTSTQ